MLERSASDGILTLRLAHGKANALDLDLLQALRAELQAVTDTGPGPSDARADRPVGIILTGTGTIFSAGVDLRRLSSGGAEYIRAFFPLLSDVLYRLFTIEVPVVAALNGHAVAGGCLLAFACDYRLMTDGGHRIGLPELSVGLPFPAVGHEIVRFAVPGHRVQSLMYTGATLTPGEALAAGFLDEVVAPESLEARAQDGRPAAWRDRAGGVRPHQAISAVRRGRSAGPARKRGRPGRTEDLALRRHAGARAVLSDPGSREIGEGRRLHSAPTAFPGAGFDLNPHSPPG